MVFGVFDGLHDGHRSFLREARKEGEWIIAAVAPDHIVHRLKGRVPDRHEVDRMEALYNEGLADRVVLGDAELASWGVLRAYRPDVVALGYDQLSLQREIESFAGVLGRPLEVMLMSAYKPESLHSSILNEKKPVPQKKKWSRPEQEPLWLIA